MKQAIAYMLLTQQKRLDSAIDYTNISRIRSRTIIKNSSISCNNSSNSNISKDIININSRRRRSSNISINRMAVTGNRISTTNNIIIKSNSNCIISNRSINISTSKILIYPVTGVTPVRARSITVSRAAAPEAEVATAVTVAAPATVATTSRASAATLVTPPSISSTVTSVAI